MEGIEAKETEARQLLLQLFWAKQVFAEPDLKDLFKKILQNYALPNMDMPHFIRDINKNLEIMGLEIRKTPDEETGIFYWGIANTRNDDLAKLATFYSPEQVILFKFIIEKLFVDNIDYEISKIDANNLRIKIEEKQMTVSKADETIQQLINDKWLRENEGMVSLGIRTFLELKTYIEEVYSDYIYECIMCQEVVIKGQHCSNQLCTVRMHNHCSQRWFESRRDNNCPTCTNPWQFPEGFVVRKIDNRPQIPAGAAVVDIRQ